MHRSRPIGYHSLEVSSFIAELFFSLKVHLSWKRIWQKRIFENEFWVHPLQLACALMKFVICIEKSLYLKEDIFSFPNRQWRRRMRSHLFALYSISVAIDSKATQLLGQNDTWRQKGLFYENPCKIVFYFSVSQSSRIACSPSLAFCLQTPVRIFVKFTKLEKGA